MDPQRRQTQSIERHRHGVPGRRHGYPRGLGRVSFQAWVSGVDFQAPSMLRVQLDTADIADNKIYGWEGRTMDDDTTAARHARSGP